MKRLMKFLHEVGTVGVMGAAAAQLVLASVAATMEPAEHALLREVIAAMVRWLLMPSLLLVLFTGAMAMAINRAYHSADWAWIKALMTPLVFETCFAAVDGPARSAAKWSARVAAGDGAAVEPLQAALRHEQAGLWAAMVLFSAQIALAVWRPRRKNRLAVEAPRPVAPDAQPVPE